MSMTAIRPPGSAASWGSSLLRFDALGWSCSASCGWGEVGEGERYSSAPAETWKNGDSSSSLNVKDLVPAEEDGRLARSREAESVPSANPDSKTMDRRVSLCINGCERNSVSSAYESWSTSKFWRGTPSKRKYIEKRDQVSESGRQYQQRSADRSSTSLICRYWTVTEFFDLGSSKFDVDPEAFLLRGKSFWAARIPCNEVRARCSHSLSTSDGRPRPSRTRPNQKPRNRKCRHLWHSHPCRRQRRCEGQPARWSVCLIVVIVPLTLVGTEQNLHRNKGY